MNIRVLCPSCRPRVEARLAAAMEVLSAPDSTPQTRQVAAEEGAEALRKLALPTVTEGRDMLGLRQ